MAFIIGNDKLGHPILLWKIRLMKPKQTTEERMQRFMFYILEKAVAQMLPGVEQYTIIADFTGSGMGNVNVSQVKKLIPVVQDYYTERMHKLYSVNTPFALRAVWKVIKLFMAKETIEKVFYGDRISIHL